MGNKAKSIFYMTSSETPVDNKKVAGNVEVFLLIAGGERFHLVRTRLWAGVAGYTGYHPDLVDAVEVSTEYSSSFVIRQAMAEFDAAVARHSERKQSND